MVGVDSMTSWSVALYPVSSCSSRRAATRASSSGPPADVGALRRPGTRQAGMAVRVGRHTGYEPAGNSVGRGRGGCEPRDEVVNRDCPDVPMTCLSSGGRYCSMMTVDNGNAFVLDLRMVKIATATGGRILMRQGCQQGSVGGQTFFSRVSLDDFAFGAFPDALCRRVSAEVVYRFPREYLFTVLVLVVDLGQPDEPVTQ